MSKIIKIISIVVVVLIAAVLGFAMTKPDSFSVQRTANIKAPPEKIFPLINTSTVGVPGNPGRRWTPQ